MSTDQNLIKAMNLAEEIADKAVRAEQDWPSIEQMAAELATPGEAARG